MRKVLLLIGLSMLGVLMFAPMAWAQDDPCPDPDFPRSTPDGCQASSLPDVPQGDTYVGEPIGAQLDGATPTATASATEEALPDTGGPVSLMALAPLALLAGSGLLAFRLVRQ